MTASTILAVCAAQGIILLPDGIGGLSINAPPEALDDDLISQLREHKAALLELLEPEAHEAHGEQLRQPVDTFPIDAARPVEAALGDSPATANRCEAETVCPCGSSTWRDVVLPHSPHNGRSTRRDCAHCGRFLDFVLWNNGAGQYGQQPIG